MGIETGEKYGRLTILGFSHKDKNWRRYYHVRCDCGTEKIAQGSLMASGNTQSCGCLSREVKAATRKPDQHREVTQLIAGYKRHAKDRGYPWNLSMEQVRDIIARDCLYCGASPANVLTGKNTIEPLVYNGIDRVDNGTGYEYTNVVACCKQCNHSKRDMSIEDFRDWAQRLGRMAEQWG